MTKKIKFLSHRGLSQYLRDKLQIGEEYKVTYIGDTHINFKADEYFELKLSGQKPIYDFVIIEETKPVKKYIKISAFGAYLNISDSARITLNKFYEIHSETSNYYFYMNDKGDEVCHMIGDGIYTVCEGHPHANLIQYAADLAKETMDVGGHFQYYDPIDEEWIDWSSNELPHFNPEYEYRIKPKTIKIGDVEINAPERKPLRSGQVYYPADIADGTARHKWRNDSIDNVWLNTGLVFLRKEDAEAAIDAMLKLLEDK